MCGPPLSPSLPSSKANALSCILDAPEVLIEISISRSHRYKLYYTSSTEGSLTAATVATLPLAQVDHADRLVSTHWSSGPGRRIGYDHLERSTCKVEHPRCPLVRAVLVSPEVIDECHSTPPKLPSSPGEGSGLALLPNEGSASSRREGGAGAAPCTARPSRCPLRTTEAPGPHAACPPQPMPPDCLLPRLSVAASTATNTSSPTSHPPPIVPSFAGPSQPRQPTSRPLPSRPHHARQLPT